MLQTALKKVFGDRNQRLLRKMQKSVLRINALEPEMQALSDEELKARTNAFRERSASGETAESLLEEAFAVVREASVRAIGLRHFDVQLIGGMVLNEGKIAEMKTGEGKTLVATLPAYLNAVCDSPVHIVTVNDYLARRDAKWMGEIYAFLELSVGVVHADQERDEKQQAYRSDIVYGTNNEFGFDYLRDNMAFSSKDRFQRGLGFAIVDEVDSILIDEARTPLIISGPSEGSVELYQEINTVIPRLTRQIEEDGPGDFTVEEKTRQVALTEAGFESAEKILAESGLLPEGGSLYDVSHIGLLHHLYAGLRAHHVFRRDVEYIVRDGTIVIIDEFTGRMMPGRRWSEGLHQAIEAKEGVPIRQENQTLASITFQNYFRLYDNLSGMTGTADTEAPEFLQIYGLEVVVIPTNMPMIRNDFPDQVYRTAGEKFEAIVEGIESCRAKQQPVLVGTASIESSELLSGILKKKKIPHQVLNAKHHEREAEIIAEAGRPGKVTIATNMAGRGTDIVLGGNLEIEIARLEEPDAVEQARLQWETRHQQVIESGGLHVLGTERNESRRVDNQLRGRCGRQGDPGSSQFYLSLEDSLMRIFGSQKISGLMGRLGMEEGEAIEHTWVTRAIENAQKKVEGHNFDMRKQLLEYDDVSNEQRRIVYDQRNELMDSDDIEYAREEVVAQVIDRSIPPQTLEEQWDVARLEQDLAGNFGINLKVAEWLEREDSLDEESLRSRIFEAVVQDAGSKESRVGRDNMRNFEKHVMLKVLDEQWKEHLANMDYLRQGIGLRGYAQKNPKQEYKREAFSMFNALLDSVRHEVISILAKVHIPTEEERIEMENRLRRKLAEEARMKYIHDNAGRSEQPPQRPREVPPDSENQPFVRTERKVGRNEPCPCGSGKKYKHCCGRL
ncbi:MAG: preprotein translocase subunit SecA [Gammaproteobacteria bacterium]|nr:preprotein translocase subunit SecA [Gammaproteobacteria bacterium]